MSADVAEGLSFGDSKHKPQSTSLAAIRTIREVSRNLTVAKAMAFETPRLTDGDAFSAPRLKEFKPASKGTGRRTTDEGRVRVDLNLRSGAASLLVSNCSRRQFSAPVSILCA